MNKAKEEKESLLDIQHCLNLFRIQNDSRVFRCLLKTNTKLLKIHICKYMFMH